jgi:lysozyme
MKNVLLLALLAAGGFVAWKLLAPAQDPSAGSDPSSTGSSTDTGSIFNTAMIAIDQAVGVFTTNPASALTTSQDMQDMLKSRERLVLEPYNLGDGGWTVGYGHFEKSRAALPAISSEADADALFAQDVASRAEKWVKLYVTVPLSQNQFDALVSIAFNMSPRSFKKFADSVNAGQGISGIAQQSVAWVAAQFTNGIQNRRDAELRVFNDGVYA